MNAAENYATAPPAAPTCGLPAEICIARAFVAWQPNGIYSSGRFPECANCDAGRWFMMQEYARLGVSFESLCEKYTKRLNWRHHTERYYRRKAAGVCVQCGKVPSRAGHIRCAACEKHMSGLKQQRRVRQRKAGRCAMCGQPSARYRCDDCRARQKESERINAKRKAK